MTSNNTTLYRGGMQQIVDFILELDKLKGVARKVRPVGLDRFENSAEHSWQIALLAASLAHLAPTPIDVDRVIRMLLVHDIGEIDTGDTFFFVEGGWEERKAAELRAVTRIFGLLPGDQGAAFLALWVEFEQAKTADARFANAADRAMPVLLNLSNRGQSWRDHGVSHETVVRRVGPPIQEGCPALWDYLEIRLEDARRQGWFGALFFIVPTHRGQHDSFVHHTTSLGSQIAQHPRVAHHGIRRVRKGAAGQSSRVRRTCVLELIELIWLVFFSNCRDRIRQRRFAVAQRFVRCSRGRLFSRRAMDTLWRLGPRWRWL